MGISHPFPAQAWIARNANAKRPLYKLGSNPPLMLAVQKNFEALDPAWNCQRGDACWETKPKARHWSGPEKPWMLAAERDAVDWMPVVKDINRSCLGPDILLDAQFSACTPFTQIGARCRLADIAPLAQKRRPRRPRAAP